MWPHNLPKALYQAQAYNGTFIHSTNIYSIFAVGQTLYHFWGIEQCTKASLPHVGLHSGGGWQTIGKQINIG